MTTSRSGLLIFISCFIAGIIALVFGREWIIIRWPTRTIPTAPHRTTTITKKKVTMYFWHHATWRQETIEMLWSTDQAEAMLYLINKWLSILDEEQTSSKKSSVQSVLLSSSGHEAYISFDRNPILKTNSTYEKYRWFEGLLKTMREAGITVQGIYFMNHHQPLHDTHLDFSRPWPLSGFGKA